MILPKVRDPRFITIRRGGTLADADHHLLAVWAATCAEHVLHHFEAVQPSDLRGAARRRRQAPGPIRELVLDDQRLRNDICWSAFDC